MQEQPLGDDVRVLETAVESYRGVVRGAAFLLRDDVRAPSRVQAGCDRYPQLSAGSLRAAFAFVCHRMAVCFALISACPRAAARTRGCLACHVDRHLRRRTAEVVAQFLAAVD